VLVHDCHRTNYPHEGLIFRAFDTVEFTPAQQKRRLTYRPVTPGRVRASAAGRGAPGHAARYIFRELCRPPRLSRSECKPTWRLAGPQPILSRSSTRRARTPSDAGEHKRGRGSRFGFGREGRNYPFFHLSHARLAARDILHRPGTSGGTAFRGKKTRACDSFLPLPGRYLATFKNQPNK